MIANYTPRERAAVIQKVERLGAVEGPAVTEATAKDGTARPSPFDAGAMARLEVLTDKCIRDLELLAAHFEGNGARLLPATAGLDVARIQDQLNRAAASYRNHCTNFPPVVRGHLSEAVV